MISKETLLSQYKDISEQKIKLQKRIQVLEIVLWEITTTSDSLSNKEFKNKAKRLCKDLFRPT